ncbi:MAG: hypothetical protein AAFV95_10495 [Bacteroidota bacterium]
MQLAILDADKRQTEKFPQSKSKQIEETGERQKRKADAEAFVVVKVSEKIDGGVKEVDQSSAIK